MAIGFQYIYFVTNFMTNHAWLKEKHLHIIKNEVHKIYMIALSL
jgi:hypothetical protein